MDWFDHEATCVIESENIATTEEFAMKIGESLVENFVFTIKNNSFVEPNENRTARLLTSNTDRMFCYTICLKSIQK